MPVWAGWALALLVIAVFCSLGGWQLDRARQKQALLQTTARVLGERRAQPLHTAEDVSQRRAYAWTAGEGRFVHAPAVLLDNQNRQGRPGVRVYRMFQPEGSQQPLLIELGWLPLPGDRTLPAIALPEGVQRVRGLLAPPPSGGLARALASRQPDGNVLATALDAPALPTLLGVRALPPRVLKLDPALPLGYARDLDILPNTLSPERHLGYAVQWFGLALAVLATALVVTWRTRRRGAGSRMRK